MCLGDDTADQHASVTARATTRPHGAARRSGAGRRRDTLPVAGTRLGEYVVQHEIGRGGMGTVFAAEHAVLGRQVAIKVLSTGAGDVETTRRFFNEARAAVLIDHPAIIDVHHVGVADDGRAYMVMERLRGESLAERLHRVERLAAPDALVIARRVTSALAAAHEAGIVHRDLKPGNVFLARNPDGDEPVVKLLDFGVAKITCPLPARWSPNQTEQHAVLGTPCYMAPEQWRAAAEVDHRVDLYALGCVLFTMLAGTPPFVSRSPHEAAEAHQHCPAPSLQPLAPGLPAALYLLVERLLAKAPAERPGSARAVADELDAIVGAMTRRVRAIRLAVTACVASTLIATGAFAMSVASI